MIDNTDAVLDILNDLGFDQISHNKVKQNVRFSRDVGHNPSSVLFDLQTLSYKCFSTNDKGNIYSLVMNRKDISFIQALNYITKKIGKDKSEFNTKIKLPFGGFYKNLIKEIQEPENDVHIYDDSILYPYRNKFNRMFLNDGISIDTQREYQVGYDIETQRITVPIWTLDGNLCGIMGRKNDYECPKEERWLPIISCPRSLTISAYHRNYKTIQQKGLCIIGESDKFPMQMHSFGSYIGLASSGCHISDTQARYIKGLLIPKIIVAYDEGLEEEYIREEAKKLKVSNSVFVNSIGYVYDRDNVIMQKDSKVSPTDMGKDSFTELIKTHVKWI